MQQTAWNDAAAYESYVGQWSRIIAPMFVQWLSPPPNLKWLDVACGTGALTSAILNSAHPAAIDAIDRSPAYLNYAREHVPDPRAHFQLGTADELPYPASSFDLAVSGLILNFIDADRALAEQCRVAKPSATIAAYIWDYAGAYDYARFFWDAAAAVDPAATEYDPKRRFVLHHADGLRQLFTNHALADVDTTFLDAQASFPNFDSYWQALDARQGSMAEYLSAIGEETRAAIRRNLAAQVQREENAPVRLRLRAIAVKGRMC
ncbi:MAG TPA: methyltransferase domain-containing protein [Bryobacteraceae bacterium]|nr:methyltransferase domain-containing protein [Bryobacteraceae bacterium]